MSGIIASNAGRSSGLVKTGSSGDSWNYKSEVATTSGRSH